MPLGPLETNSYLVGCETTHEAAIIDPAWSGRAIATMAENDGWRISHILLTHSHFDHVGGLSELKEATQAPVFIHPKAIEMLRQASMSAALYGYQLPNTPPPDEMLEAGQIISVGRLQLHVLYTPGHAPGHVSFYLPEHNVLFDGDVLFKQSIGRTDFPGGSYAELMNTIREEFLILPDETQVFSGHGPATTIGEERLQNPFLQDIV